MQLAFVNEQARHEKQSYEGQEETEGELDDECPGWAGDEEI